MPAYCARWPDGSFSIVTARNQKHAIFQLDELGDEPADIWPLEACLIDFELTDQGTVRLKQFGELTGPAILERSYPILSEVRSREVFRDDPVEDGGTPIAHNASEAEAIRKAVELERNRCADFEGTPASTEVGKKLQKELGASGILVDALVKREARRTLKRFRAGKEDKPS